MVMTGGLCFSSAGPGGSERPLQPISFVLNRSYPFESFFRVGQPAGEGKPSRRWLMMWVDGPHCNGAGTTLSSNG